MSDLPVALQLYSVRKACAEDLMSVLEHVAAWGYDGVEFAGLHGHAASDIRAKLDELELRCAGAHVPIDALDEGNIDATLSDYETLRCPYVIVPYLPESHRDSEASTRATAERFGELAERVEARGMRAGFHAHHVDMQPLESGRSPWDILAENTPAGFILQYDTANGMAGGADPVAPIENHPGRTVSLHLKEYADGHGHGIGQGDVPFAEVLDAAGRVGGTQWLVIEQEGHPTLEPMEAARASLEGLRGLIASR